MAAPSVIEFDADGNVVSSWGGPGYNPDWPDIEHGIFVDGKNNVWLTGSGNKDGTLLKFTRDGKFLAKFGKQGPTAGSQDTTALGGTASIALDRAGERAVPLRRLFQSPRHRARCRHASASSACGAPMASRRRT